MTPLPLNQALPAELRAGDALSFSVQTLAPTAQLFLVLSAVISNTPVQVTIGGAGVAVDASGVAAFTAPSSVTTKWLPGAYRWTAFSLDASGNRTQVAQGRTVITPDVGSGTPVDPRTRNERILDNIRAVLEGTSTDDVASYKIGGRELVKIPRKDLLMLEGVYASRVRKERIRRGELVPSNTVGITFGGR